MKQTVVSRPFKTKWEHDHLLKNNYYTCVCYATIYQLPVSSSINSQCCMHPVLIPLMKVMQT